MRTRPSAESEVGARGRRSAASATRFRATTVRTETLPSAETVRTSSSFRLVRRGSGDGREEAFVAGDGMLGQSNVALPGKNEIGARERQRIRACVGQAGPATSWA